MSLLPVGISGEEAGYQIERSLRFNSADSAYLNRTPASAGNRKTWTWSGWVKRSGLGTGQILFKGGTTGVNGWSSLVLLMFTTGNVLRVNSNNDIYLVTNAVFRDPSAWYYVSLVCDTTQASASNRLNIYVNGVLQTYSTDARATYISQNSDSAINTTTIHEIGRNGADANYFNGYLTEINFIDGSALDPTSFGEFNEDTGVWQPIEYTGSYGTNGFYLNFSDNSGTTSTTLGKDQAGSNNWTPNNFSVTAGAGNDSLVDTPTPYGTDTGLGGEVRGNYATLNTLAVGPYASLSNGNLRITSTSSSNSSFSYSTIAVTSGKWYYEVNNTGSGYDASHFAYIGVATKLDATSLLQEGFADYRTSGDTYSSSGGTGSGRTVWTTTGDIVACAIDADNGAIYFRDKNGAWLTSGVPTSGASRTGAITTFTPGSKTLYAGAGAYQNSSQFVDVNFGQRPFAYTAPSGFASLCTQNLPEPTIVDGGEYFNTVARPFTGATAVITGLGFSPDFLWFKRRNTAASHSLFDRLRGTNARLLTNGTNAEITTTSAELTSFDADGFTIGSDPGSISINSASGDTGVVWAWKANGAGVSNTDGSITSTVSANTTSGFSIVSYTGTRSSDGGETGTPTTIGHGLTQRPDMIITKARETTANANWNVWHSANQVGEIYENDQIWLNLTNANNEAGWQRADTGITDTVFCPARYSWDDVSGIDYIAYVFHSVEGFSKFGSYTGNGSADGPFVYTGFRPAFVMVKSSNAANGWIMFNSANLKYNLVDNDVEANDSRAEVTGSTRGMDWLSNGFKLRSDFGSRNGSGTTYIYMAFAETPFSLSLAR